MTPATNAVLAQLSLDAYSDAPTLPPGVIALDPSNFLLPLAPGETFSQGVFHSGNAAALLTTETIDGLPSIVIAFRGSDDAVDSQQDLGNINLSYDNFASLLNAVDANAAATGLQVVVTGHSLGGAMAQIYMANHPDVPGGPAHQAVTFGSPGALLPPAEDARITNYVIADDPAVVLGAHRAEIGALLRSDPMLADLAADRAAEAFPGLTHDQALASLTSLTANYDNRGDIVLLPGADGKLDLGSDLSGLAQLDPARHAPDLYATEAAAAVTPGYALDVPAAPTGDPELALLHAIYDGDARDPAAASAAATSLLQAWASDLLSGDPGLLGQAQTGINQLGQELQQLL